MAVSSALPVIWMLPGSNMVSVAAVLTPRPISRPVGVVTPSATAAPAGRISWYIRSWKSARLCLKPTVLTLARLLEMTSMLVCWAIIPVAAE